jgi:hypothetical protein
MFVFVALSVACDNVFAKNSDCDAFFGIPRFKAESLSYVLFGRAAEKATL